MNYMIYGHNDVVSVKGETGQKDLSHCRILGSHTLPNGRTVHFAIATGNGKAITALGFFDDSPELELVRKDGLFGLLDLIGFEATSYYPIELFLKEHPTATLIFHEVGIPFGLDLKNHKVSS